MDDNGEYSPIYAEAVPTPSYANADVEWSISKGDVSPQAECTINEYGVITILDPGAEGGSVVVTATAKSDPSITGQASFAHPVNNLPLD